MAVVDKYIDQIGIDETSFNNVIHSIFEFTKIKRDYNSTSIISKKEELINSIIPMLEKYLELNIATDRSKKLEIIYMLDKFNFTKEILDIRKKNINLKDIEQAGMRLGKKSQSSFESNNKLK